MHAPTHVSQNFFQIQYPRPLDRILHFMRQWIDSIEVDNPQVARWLSQLIPAQCPFEQDIQLFGKTLFHIPPLCKLNPLYDQLMSLRFRALIFLADVCDENVA